MSFLKGAIHSLSNDASELEEALHAKFHSHTHLGAQCHHLHPHHERSNPYHSSAPPRTGNDVKWFVDGCGYMWAVSVAIEQAQESIWILDWWLSPELYLRRPPSANERFRLDRMLLAAAERGVRVNVIVYKEVANILTLCSEHTKKALEIHPNIAVFRHPDHIPSSQVLESEIISGLKNFSFQTKDLTQLPEDGLKALYGMNSDIILYWAHHEKLCLIDGTMAFMGGLDLCFGRWDTNAHPIADAHPTDINQILFPGQDYNNARIYDFEDVSRYDHNKLNRTQSSRMGWSDLSICVQGPVIEDLRAHFVQRWNFIYWEKYDVQRDARYHALSLTQSDVPDNYYKPDGKAVRHVREADTEDEDRDASTEGFAERHHLHLPGGGGSIYDGVREALPEGLGGIKPIDLAAGQRPGGMSAQLVRSCTRWSNGSSTEHSIANAYIQVIRDSKHFIYIENQFFITATTDAQHPIRNKIGAAIAERVIRAWRNHEPYRIIVCMPSIPAFAGDLHADSSLGTRAIMKFQYDSICRGGHSIIETIERAGVPDAGKYIRFYNLRTYDRIQADGAMADVEAASGVVGAGYDGHDEETGAVPGQHNENYDRYQQVAAKQKHNNSKHDTVSSCYMDNSTSLPSIPWHGSPESELDALVSEELYIHSKLLIADDRIVICGSANLNDRSQLGYHDSEIALVIEDPTPIESLMDGKPYTASAFATSLRRQLFRKHLGLLPFQDWTAPDGNFMPVNKGPNEYDWGSPADLLVRDVLSRPFANLWDGTARANTAIFARAFHCVPDDRVRDWTQYEEFFSRFFVSPDSKGESQSSDNTCSADDGKAAPRYQYGHVVKEEFPGGVAELKAWLGGVRGSLVEMPLRFMEGVDFAREGLRLNVLTEEIYT